MPLASIKKVRNLKGKRVIVRVDFNVPINNKKITDNTKLTSTAETINYLRKKGAIVILVSHLGRPNGKRIKSCEFTFSKDPKYSLKVVVKDLNKILPVKVKFISHCLGKRLSWRINMLRNGSVVLLENIRFYKEEKEGDVNFAKKLASLGDIYVAEAFGVSHRGHASVLAIKKYLPSYSGFLVQREIENLNKLKDRPKKPYVALLGGAKLSTKIKLINKLNKKVDTILIGGAMANVFLKAKNLEIGRSLVEESMIGEAKKILRTSKKIITPKDVVVAQKIESGVKIKVKRVQDVKKRDIILDIGPITIIEYSRALRKAKSILWNGPMGKFEFREFSNGSLVLARLIAAVSRGRAYGICGGGETIDVLKRTGMEEYVDWVSTGGGAMLAYLSGDKMPGIK
jgi:phosphoglycerate kinase